MVQHLEGRPDEANETQPLLSSPHTEVEQGVAIRPVAPSLSPHRSRSTWPWQYVFLVCMVLAVASDIGEYLYFAPRVRLFESVACIAHYLREDPSLVDADGSVPERLCKINPVQDRVAWILGWQLFFDSIPAILLPVPYGYVADRKGRKWILILGIMGYTLSWAATLFFVGLSECRDPMSILSWLILREKVGVLHLPLPFVWLSSVFFLLGGGPTTATTLITTVVADVVPPELRSTVFFYRFCTDLIAECLVPPVTAILMVRNVWIPLILAVLFQGLGGIITLILPETLPVAIPNHENGGTVSPSLATESTDTNVEPDEELGVREKLRRMLRQTKDSFKFITSSPSIIALVFTFLISKVGRQSINILLQYVSTRYGWSLSKAGLLLSLRAAVNIMLYVVILPSIAAFALSRLSAAPRDLLIAKASILLMILGTTILFFSVTPALMILGLIIYTVGTGFAPIVRSLVTFLVESQHTSQTSDIGRLYALICVMEGIGSLIAGPGMAWAFRIGLNLGQNWLGMPFGFAAILFASISIIVFSIRLRVR